MSSKDVIVDILPSSRTLRMKMTSTTTSDVLSIVNGPEHSMRSSTMVVLAFLVCSNVCVHAIAERVHRWCHKLLSL